MKLLGSMLIKKIDKLLFFFAVLFIVNSALASLDEANCDTENYYRDEINLLQNFSLNSGVNGTVISIFGGNLLIPERFVLKVDGSSLKKLVFVTNIAFLQCDDPGFEMIGTIVIGNVEKCDLCSISRKDADGFTFHEELVGNLNVRHIIPDASQAWSGGIMTFIYNETYYLMVRDQSELLWKAILGGLKKE